MVEYRLRSGPLVGIWVHHLGYQFVEVSAETWQDRYHAISQIVPLGSILRKRTTARHLEERDAQRKNVGLEEIRVVLLKDLLGQISAVALLDMGLFNGSHMAQVADFVRYQVLRMA